MSDIIDRLIEGSEAASNMNNRQLACELYDMVSEGIADEKAVLLMEAARRLVVTELLIIEKQRDQ
jgi:hypothetical protein